MTATCCCAHGAAVAGEWPESECDDCPVHLRGLGPGGRRCRRHRTAAGAEAAGYTVDRSCYPWVAYRGARFAPDEWFPLITPGAP